MANSAFSVVEQLGITALQVLLHRVIKNPTSAKAKRLREILTEDVQPLIDEALAIIPE